MSDIAGLQVGFGSSGGILLRSTENMTQTCNLFVYGTLRPDAISAMGRAMRRRLAAQSDVLGPATLAGRLVNLGRYPGMIDEVPPACPGQHSVGHRVVGDVLTLSDPGATWLWLDAYEGVNADDPEGSLYERAVRHVRLTTDHEVPAWVYLLRTPPRRARVIASGDWLNR